MGPDDLRSPKAIDTGAFWQTVDCASSV